MVFTKEARQAEIGDKVVSVILQSTRHMEDLRLTLLSSKQLPKPVFLFIV